MADNRFIGPEGANWFDPANWSENVVPAAGDTVDLFDTQLGSPDGPDATGGTVAGVTINLVEPSLQVSSEGFPTGLDDPAFSLVAGALGTAAAPVTLQSTTDMPNQFATYIDRSTIEVGTFTGTISLAPLATLTFAAPEGGSGTTIDGDVTMGVESSLNFTSFTTAATGTVAAAPVTINGRITTGGGGSAVSVYSDLLTGTGSVVIAAGGGFNVVQDGSSAPAVETLAVDFAGTAAHVATLDVTGLRAGYGGTISGFGAGDSIVAASVAGDSLTTSFDAGVLTVTDAADGQQQHFTFAGSYNPAFFQIFPQGAQYRLTYGPTDTYTGGAGGSWFNDANWSAGVAPPPSVLARVYGSNGVDSTSGTIDNAVIDLSGTLTDAGTGADGTLIDPRFNLAAGQIGTSNNPTFIEVTGNSGTRSDAGLTFSTLDGGIEATAGQTLSIGVSQQGAAIAGGLVSVDAGATIDIVGYGPTAFAPTITGLQADVSGTLLLGGVSAGAASSSIISLSGGTFVVANVDPNAVAVSVFFPEINSADADATGTLDVRQNAGGYAGTIYDFGEAGEHILARNVGAAGASPTVSFAGDVLTITQAGASGPDAVQTFTFDGTYTLADFDVTVVSADTIEISAAPCFASGTSIETTDGAVPVERLAAGQSVVLAGGGASRVTWTGHRRQHGGTVVRVRAGALGAGRPVRDLLVSEDHGLLVDGVLVPAGLLVDEAAIVREERAVVTFWHVELERHAVLLAEGAPAESYLDTGNRRQFSNCGLGYDPAMPSAMEPCAEMVLAGERLVSARAAVARSRREDTAKARGSAPGPRQGHALGTRPLVSS